VKIAGYRLGGKDRHVCGQSRVQRGHHSVRRDPAIGFEAHDLAFRMRARVGAPGGMDLVVFARDLAQRSLQLGFHRAPCCCQPAKPDPSYSSTTLIFSF
jgi:hypothetical protein